jgi:hypothetical protein
MNQDGLEEGRIPLLVLTTGDTCGRLIHNTQPPAHWPPPATRYAPAGATGGMAQVTRVAPGSSGASGAGIGSIAGAWCTR